VPVRVFTASTLSSTSANAYRGDFVLIEIEFYHSGIPAICLLELKTSWSPVHICEDQAAVGLYCYATLRKCSAAAALHQMYCHQYRGFVFLFAANHFTQYISRVDYRPGHLERSRVLMDALRYSTEQLTKPAPQIGRRQIKRL
jgi:hypothetical protein